MLRSLWGLGKVGLGGLVTRAVFSVVAWARPGIWRGVLRDYRPTEADVFVCTYAKSGTNWMMQIVTQIADRGAADFDHIHDVVPWPEAPVPSQVAPLDTPAVSVTGLRAVKTHILAEHVPVVDAARYVVVIRDPKDVFVSSFHFVDAIVGGIWGAPPSMPDWYARWTRGGNPLGSWAEHTAGWWALRERDNVLVLTFAELKEDLGVGVDRVAALMGVVLTPEERSAVVERSEFAWMKANDQRFINPLPALEGERAAIVRAGKKGSASELLSAEQRAEIDELAKAQLQALGSAFPYDELFTGR